MLGALSTSDAWIPTSVLKLLTALASFDHFEDIQSIGLENQLFGLTEREAGGFLHWHSFSLVVFRTIGDLHELSIDVARRAFVRGTTVVTVEPGFCPQVFIDIGFHDIPFVGFSL